MWSNIVHETNDKHYARRLFYRPGIATWYRLQPARPHYIIEGNRTNSAALTRTNAQLLQNIDNKRWQNG